MTDGTARKKAKARNKRIRRIAAATSATIGVIAALFGIYVGLRGLTSEPATEADSSPHVARAAPATTSPLTSPVAAPPSASQGDATSDDDATTSPPAALQVYNVSQLQEVSSIIENRPGQCTGGCTGFGAEAASIGGHTYPDAYVMRVVADGSRSIVEYSATNSCTDLTAEVGLKDGSSPVTIRFSLIRDNGAAQELAIVPPGHPVKVTATLKGVYDFKLVASVTSAPADTSGEYAVWGDAQIRCSSGEQSQVR